MLYKQLGQKEEKDRLLKVPALEDMSGGCWLDSIKFYLASSFLTEGRSRCCFSQRFMVSSTFSSSSVGRTRTGQIVIHARAAASFAVQAISRTRALLEMLASIGRRSSSFNRSEERRVGKECRSRWSPY